MLARSFPLLLASVALPFSALGEETVSFSRDVLPILSDKCFYCHGQDETHRKADRRLDTQQGALAEKDGVRAIVPGDLEKSDAIARILSSDLDEVMPPPKANKKLTAAQIATLRQWVAEGAKWGAHWAFIPPVRPPLPESSSGNPIDASIRARLARENIVPSPEADKQTLLRRLSLDLTGLPPSPQEIDAFLADAAPDAFERQAGRLLASPHFGEKWARHWLDAARYADSDGYEKDLPREQWAWRDWVINSLNADKPYDQFIIEQLGGDLLPNATQDQRVATGFLRNGMVNEEGAIIAEQFRMEGMFDRIDTLGKSVLGLTVQCAQCHSHKFDPFTHEEYYKLFAFLNDDYESTQRVYSREQQQKIADLARGIADAERRVKSKHPDWPQRLAQWAEEQRSSELPWEVLFTTEQDWHGGLAHPQAMPDGSVLTLGFRPTSGELHVIGETKAAGLTGLRLEALSHGDLPFEGPGRSYKGAFAISEMTVEAQPPGASDWKKVELANATADFSQSDQPIEEAFRKHEKEKDGKDKPDNRRVGPAAFLIDGNEETAWNPDRGAGRRNQASQAVAQFREPFAFPAGTRLKVTFKYRHGGPDNHGRQNNFLGRFRLALTTAPNPKADPLPAAAREALHVPEEKRTGAQQAAVFAAWLSNCPECKSANDEIEKLWAQFPEPSTTVLALARRAPEQHRETTMFERGNWQKPGRKVTPGVPAFLHPLPADAAPDRLTFARWLVEKRSPTAARVAVNRIWQAIFGIGIVETTEDFGVQGAAPSHPELLDWLACEFMERGWSQKQIIREIVTSAAYRQSSRATPEMLERDPRNRLLARGPRFRADAEAVRDIALSAAGLLTDKLGGPSVFPPVPDSLFASSFLDVDFWKTAQGADRYRRSIYLFRRRSMPDPVLSSFDAPNGDLACARRARSNSPLAALAALNEPVFLEAARSLALRTLREAPAGDAARAAYAFRLCTGREPRDSERDEILALLRSRRQRLADGWISARELATGDGSMPALPAGATPSDAAVWTIIARVLLNLDETLNKG